MIIAKLINYCFQQAQHSLSLLRQPQTQAAHSNEIVCINMEKKSMKEREI